MVDAQTDTPLEGALFALLFAANAHAVLDRVDTNSLSVIRIADKEWMDDIRKSANSKNKFLESYIQVDELPEGKYFIDEIEGPSMVATVEDPSEFSSSTPESGNETDQATLVKQFEPVRKAIIVKEVDRVQSFKILHHDNSTHFYDATGAQIKEQSNKLIILSLINLVHGFRHPFQSLSKLLNRTTITQSRAFITSLFKRTHLPNQKETAGLCSIFFLCLISLVALYFIFIAPFICVIGQSISVYDVPGFGGQFLFANISGYFSRFIFHGWEAVSLLGSSYPEVGIPLGFYLITVTLLFVLIILLIRKFATFFSPINPILKEQPPRIEDGPNVGTKGSDSLITDEKIVASTLSTCNYSNVEEDLIEGGIYCGFIGQTPAQVFFNGCINTSISAIENFAQSALYLNKSESFQSWNLDSIKREPKGNAVYLGGDNHGFIIADTRGGKTRLILIPTIELLSRCSNESLIIFDPKGEIYGQTSEAVSARMPVYVIDMSEPLRSHRWNPLTPAIMYWKMGDYVRANTAVTEVIEAIAPKLPNEGQSKYFNDGARAQMRSACLYIISDPKCPDNQKTLSTVARFIETYMQPTYVDPTKPTKTFIPYEEMLEQLPNAYDHPAYEAYSAARGANPKEAKSFTSTSATYLSLFRDPAIEAMMSVTDLPITDIADKRCAVYLIIPTHKRAYRPFSTLFLDQAYSALIEHAQSGTGRCKQRVNFIWDEVCSINKWDNLSSAINYGAGVGIRFYLFVQNLSIFENLYGREAAGIYSNCNYKIFLKTGDIKNTAPEISRTLGSYTIETENTTYSGSRFLPLTNKSVSHSPAERKVLSVSEVMRWKSSYGAIVLTGDQPLVVPLPDISQTPVEKIFGLGDIRHNLIKTLDARMARSIIRPSSEQHYFPELPEIINGVTYSDKKRKALRASFIASLAKYHARRIADVQQPSNNISSDQAKQAVYYAAAFNELTGELKRWDEGITASLTSVINNPAYKVKIDISKKQIDSWVAAKKTKYKEHQKSQIQLETNKPKQKPKRRTKQGSDPPGQQKLDLFESS